MTVKKGILYDRENQLTLDLYEISQAKGIVIAFHGGGWFRGDKKKEAAIAEKFNEAGYLVITPNYRLAPEHFFPAAMADALKVYEWTCDNYKTSNLPVMAYGSSAGGNLAIELALQKGIPAVSWSGIIDLQDWVKKHPQVKAAMNQKKDFDQKASAKIDQTGTNDAFYKWFILNYVNQDPILLQEATPITRVTEKSGPIFMANSLNELVPVSGVLMLQKALADNQVPSEVKLIAGSQHGEGYQEKVWAASLAFLNEQ